MAIGRSTWVIIILAAIALLFLMPRSVVSTFTMDGSPFNNQGSVAPASLMPKEPPLSQDFSLFSSEAILSSQNYLDPRNMIGYPETMGGTLRNANYQIRSEPPNPRDPVSIFNLSTIAPEQMRPYFEISQNDYSSK